MAANVPSTSAAPAAGDGGVRDKGPVGQSAWPASKGWRAESIKLVGGLVALASGLLVLGVIAGGALAVNSDDAVKIATGAFGVIGTLVGAYFGQKIGSDGVREATSRADREATKAQIYAAHLPASEAPRIVALAHAAGTGKTLDPTHTPDVVGG